VQDDDEAGDDEGLEKHRHQQRSKRRKKAERVTGIVEGRTNMFQIGTYTRKLIQICKNDKQME